MLTLYLYCRSKELESGGEAAALQGVEIQAVVTEILILNADLVLYLYCRSKELESGFGAAALQGVGIQAVVTEFLILYADLVSLL